MRKGSAFPERPIGINHVSVTTFIFRCLAENEARARVLLFSFRELLRFRFSLLGSGVLCVSSPRGAGSI
jgi:hypothetical protein